MLITSAHTARKKRAKLQQKIQIRKYLDKKMKFAGIFLDFAAKY